MMLTEEQTVIHSLSKRLVDAQKNIRILDAIKWDDSVKKSFLAKKGEAQPQVDAQFYQKYPLPYVVEDKKEEFRLIMRDAQNQLGQYSAVTRMLKRQCEEYIRAVMMLDARGTPLFCQVAEELYGSPDDVFYLGGPKLCDLGTQLFSILNNLDVHLQTPADEKRHTAQAAQAILQQRLSHFFDKHVDRVTVSVSSDMVADAAAGADHIRLNEQVMFSDRDLAYLEVHEGWVHVGTTLNGEMQPFCSFLSKGTPACSVLQEGLAVITEVFTFSSNPRRLTKITNRVIALDMVKKGANFIDVFRYFLDSGLSEDESYNHATRVFRGSIPTGGAFTKDLSYAKGFIQIYNFILFAIANESLASIPLLFSGKLVMEDLPLLKELQSQGLLIAPTYIPTPFRDFSALSVLLSMMLFLNKFDMEKVQQNYKFLL